MDEAFERQRVSGARAAVAIEDARTGRLSRRELLALAARAGALVTAAPFMASLASCTRVLISTPQTLATPGLQSPTSAVLKPPLRGFLDEAGLPIYDWMLGYVRNLNWADLQASAYGPIVSTNRLASDIQAVRAFNAAHPNQPPRGLKLRTGAAGGAPNDVKTIGGGPFRVSDPQTAGATAEIGAFWLREYQNAYADFQSKLAAWLDPLPELREVTMALPALVFEEPFVRYSTDILAQGGWTLSLDQKSFTAMLNSHQVWRNTRQDLAYTWYNAPGGPRSWSLAVLNTARTMYGPQLVDGNNAIKSTSKDSPLYQAIMQAGPPIYFQIAGISQRGSVSKTFDFAVVHGANSVEIGKYSGIAESILLNYQNKLLAAPT